MPRTGEAVTKHSFWEDCAEVGTAIVAFIKCSKIYLFIMAGISWLFSTYDIKGILIIFASATVLDTITRINADARNAKLPFKPYKMFFWRRIKSGGLKKMGRKIFVEYGIAVFMAFMLDIYLFKNTIHFNLLTLKLNIPMAAILFFTGIEIWSIFENIEEGGNINWLKRALNWFSDWIPEKWKKVFKKIKEDETTNN